MRTEAQKTRIVWLDVVKYICIITVMIPHLEAVTDVWHAFFLLFSFLFPGMCTNQKISSILQMMRKARPGMPRRLVSCGQEYLENIRGQLLLKVIA